MYSGIRLKLELKLEMAAPYKSASQRARVLTEIWARENLYCSACPSNKLTSTVPGKKVVDFICPDCDEPYQLKSQSHPFGNRVMNSAYEPKIKAIQTGAIPNFIFLRYDLKVFRVLDLFLVPKHFVTQSIIERRKPLREGARRYGWVGSNILLGNLPSDARIPIVEDGQVIPATIVRNSWNQFLFLREQSLYSRGWLADVLTCIRELGREKFTLVDIYTFERRLGRLHPRNKHIRPKIRQQLQILRDHRIIDFLGEGVYQIKKS